MYIGYPKRLLHFVSLFLLPSCLAIFSCNQQKPVTADKEKPEDSRFTKVVLGNTKKKQDQGFDIDFALLDKLMSSQVTATLTPVEGMHTVYFVFKNNQAKAKQSLMKMSEINFQNAASVPAAPKK